MYEDLPLNRLGLFFTEETRFHTSSLYSSKTIANLLVLAYHRTFGFSVSVCNCSNNYSPYHFLEKLMLLMVVIVLNDKPFPVCGKRIKSLNGFMWKITVRGLT